MTRPRRSNTIVVIGLALIVVGFPVGGCLAGQAVLYETPCQREGRHCLSWEAYRWSGSLLVLAGVGTIALLIGGFLVATIRDALTARSKAKRAGRQRASRRDDTALD
jgi:hypothetical protein